MGRASSIKDPNTHDSSNRVKALYELVRAKMIGKGGVIDAADVHEVCSAIGEWSVALPRREVASARSDAVWVTGAGVCSGADLQRCS
jgi:hypothetical protein